MSIVVGIDEVGYGPKLGPLVVCAYAFRAADPAIDLWQALKPVVHRRPARGLLAVADSKLLYSPARGVGSIEATALAFLSVLPKAEVGSLRAVARRLTLDGEDCLAHSPWYDGHDLALPIETERREVDRLGTELWGALQRARALPAGCWAAWAEPARFNRAVSSTANKADFLFDRACSLIHTTLDSLADDGDVSVFVGKQGGRRFYLPGLVREFGSISILAEERGTSTYEFRRDGRRVRVSFLVDGEERHFGIALASIVGKYLRECAMRRFNDWWRALKPGLRPTAGYGTDGSRFFREVEPELARLNLERDQVLRRR